MGAGLASHGCGEPARSSWMSGGHTPVIEEGTRGFRTAPPSCHAGPAKGPRCCPRRHARRPGDVGSAGWRGRGRTPVTPGPRFLWQQAGGDLVQDLPHAGLVDAQLGGNGALRPSLQTQLPNARFPRNPFFFVAAHRSYPPPSNMATTSWLSVRFGDPGLDCSLVASTGAG
jgi:hypothetical protein